MEFVTIHDLSRELNTPARVIRYRLINLIADGKLKENEDFRRDEFKDDQHFVWKIKPAPTHAGSALRVAVSHCRSGASELEKARSTSGRKFHGNVLNPP